ncbi:hypothetical protein [Roseateles sp.]|uniref:hypothetical protein n=1 Tax=Roseateles sp. TaxID=1971397 RepID=UPI0025F45EDE|nr:hypothetical protein [Roseateles sp.]MBV8033875.1 hypothetical protein [Roseateles sp.]
MKLKSATALLAGWLALGTVLAAPECDAPPQVDLAKIQARVIVVGELRGTEQAPAFVGQLVCGLLKSGRPVILALEREGQEQVALNSYLASAGRPSDVRALVGTGAWAGPFQDGGSSEAMLALIEQVRLWRQAGQRVGVLAMRFDRHPIAPPATDRSTFSDADIARYEAILERTMADKVWVTQITHQGYTIVALAGNVLTTLDFKARVRANGPSFAEMLASYTSIHVIGLNTSAGGTRWQQRPNGKSGPGPLTAGPMFIAGTRIDTEVDLGQITASPPASAAR